MDFPNIQWLETDSELIAPVAYIDKPATKDKKDKILYLAGYECDMDHKMVLAMEKFLHDHAGYQFAKFDYAETGKSLYTTVRTSDGGWSLLSPASNAEDIAKIPAKYLDQAKDPNTWSLLQWRKDVIKMIKNIGKGEPVILVAYDMGVWLAMMAAMRIPNLIKKIMCISSNFDFFLRIFDSMNCENQGKCKDGKIVYCDHVYDRKITMTVKLVMEGKGHGLLTRGDSLPIRCPVRFCHNIHDTVSPYKDVLALADKLDTDDMQIVAVKDMIKNSFDSHDMSDRKSLSIVYKTLASFLDDDDLRQFANEEAEAIKKIEDELIANPPPVEPIPKTKKKYQECYRFPLPLKKDKVEREFTPKWNFVVYQELEDEKQSRKAARKAGQYQPRELIMFSKERSSKLDPELVRFMYRAPPLPALAYVWHKAHPRAKPGLPLIIYCGDFMNEMCSMKAAKIERFMRERKFAFIRFDYTDHGMSNMEFHPSRPPSPVEEGATERDRNKHKIWSFEQWRMDLMTLIEELVVDEEQKIILIGHGMGVWLSILAALEYPELVKGIVGISTAIDFFPNYIESFFTTKQRTKMENGDIIWIDGPMGTFVGSQAMVDESKKYHLLDRDEIDLNCPMRFCHCGGDEWTPVDDVEKLVSKLTATDIEVYAKNGGDHKMSSEKDYATIYKTINALLNSVC